MVHFLKSLHFFLLLVPGDLRRNAISLFFVLVLMIASGGKLDHLSSLFSDGFAIFSSHTLQQILVLYHLASNQLRINASESRIFLDDAHNISERSVAEINRVLQYVKDLY